MGVEEAINEVSPTTGRGNEKDERVIVQVDFEAGDVGKNHYSKTSVWLMVLYSGLAIGSDG